MKTFSFSIKLSSLSLLLVAALDPQLSTFAQGNGFTYQGRLTTGTNAVNMSSPLSNWTVLDSVTEISPGQFQFTDPQATNNPQRLYRARCP